MRGKSFEEMKEVSVYVVYTGTKNVEGIPGKAVASTDLKEVSSKYQNVTESVWMKVTSENIAFASVFNRIGIIHRLVRVRV